VDEVTAGIDEPPAQRMRLGPRASGGVVLIPSKVPSGDRLQAHSGQAEGPLSLSLQRVSVKTYKSQRTIKHLLAKAAILPGCFSEYPHEFPLDTGCTINVLPHTHSSRNNAIKRLTVLNVLSTPKPQVNNRALQPSSELSNNAFVM